MQLYLHLLDIKNKPTRQTLKCTITDKHNTILHLKDLLSSVLQAKFHVPTNAVFVHGIFHTISCFTPLAANRAIRSFFNDGSDVYCSITVDQSQTIAQPKIEEKKEKPVEIPIQTPVEKKEVKIEEKKVEPKKEEPKKEEKKEEEKKEVKRHAAKPKFDIEPDEHLKYKTLTSYSFYESGKSYVKVLITLNGVENQPKSDIIVNFYERALEVKVKNMNGAYYLFRVPKLHCFIQQKSCSWAYKKNTVVLTLRKDKDDDNWWSLFKAKCVGEVDSD